MRKIVYRHVIMLLLFTTFLSACSKSKALPINNTTSPDNIVNTPITNITDTPQPTPTPTVLPEVNLENGEYALFTGNFTKAVEEFELAKTKTSDSQTLQLADLGIAQAYISLSNYSTALEMINNIIEQKPNQEILWKTYYFQAICFQNLNKIPESISSYQNLIENAPPAINEYFYELIGDQYIKLFNYSKAIDAFNSAIDSNPNQDTAWLKIKIGNAYMALSDYTNAIRIFMEVHDSSPNEYVRAQTNFLAGQAYLSLELPEQAYARFQESVENYPKAYDTYSGLVALVNAGIPVSELNRGLIDYYAGKYGLAIDAFDRYMAATPDHNGTALYYKGLSYQAISEYSNAIAEWEILINSYPDDRFYVDAWEEIAYSQWAHFNEYDNAAKTLKSFVAKNPVHEKAPQLLYDSGRILERGNYLTDAAETWSRLIDEYPQSDYAARGLFLSGVTYYRLERFDDALNQFQRSLLLSSQPADTATAAFWLGKTYQIMNNLEQANTFFQQAATADPTGYYSERAKEIINNQQPFTTAQDYKSTIDLDQERVIAEVWMRSTFSLENEYDFTTLEVLNQNPYFRRGQVFWEIGLYEEARREFDIVQENFSSDPLNLFRLTNYFVKIGLYRSAIFSSRQVLDLANLNDLSTFDAPKWFNHIRFGLYYQDIVENTSIQYGFDPLLIFSLIRQESFFEGFISSGVGARGVMQIMPATGNEIASFSNWPPNYVADDLYLPYINIKMGVNYLNRQMNFFDGDTFSALAAYNAGPGNVLQWQEIAKYDPDLFLEVIPYEETRRYIIHIFEFYKIYQKLYEIPIS
jgi:soluble lytic murein transglycosylase